MKTKKLTIFDMAERALAKARKRWTSGGADSTQPQRLAPIESDGLTDATQSDDATPSAPRSRKLRRKAGR